MIIYYFFNRTEPLAARTALGMSYSIIQIFGYIPVFGISENLGVLCSKLVAMKRYKKVVEIGWYTLVVLGIIFFFYIMPAAIIFVKSLSLMNVDPEVVELTPKCFLFCAPYLVLVGFSLNVLGYCNAQEIEKSFMVTDILVVFIHLGTTYFIIGVHKMGIFGVGLCFFITELCTLTFYVIIMKVYCHPESLAFPNFKGFSKKICPYFCDCVKFIISASIEDFIFEINSIFIILFYTTADVSSYFNALNFVYTVYVFGIGMGIVLRTQVSYLLGSGNKKEAKNLYFTIVLFHGVVCICLSSIPYFFSMQIARIYAVEEDLLDIISGMFQLYAFTFWIDLMSATVQVGVKATNKMHLMINTILVIILPINIVLCLVKVFLFKS